MATQKPVEWVTSLITRFEEQVSAKISLDIVVVHILLLKFEEMTLLLKINRARFMNGLSFRVGVEREELDKAW